MSLPDMQKVRDVALGDLIGMVKALNEAVKIQHEIIVDLATQSSNYNAHIAGLLGELEEIKFPEPTKLKEKIQ